MKNPQTLILILGDQLSPQINALQGADKKNTIVLMAEVMAEANYVRHHKQKIAFIFSAMRHFADSLQHSGWDVRYTKLDDPDNRGSLKAEVERALQSDIFSRVLVTEPGEWRLWQDMQSWSSDFGITVDILPDTRFLCSRELFADWAHGRKQLRMEYFYRDMRRNTGLLMQGDEPEGGTWNYDSENRKTAKQLLSDSPLLRMPPLKFSPDEITKSVLQLVAHAFPDNIGTLDDFNWAVTDADVQRALDHFISHNLAHFGDYQDAMIEDDTFLHHSLLSPYINAGLLDPLDVCRRVELAYSTGKVPLNAAEGYIRQIIGWREYVRGIYWLKMPTYIDQNFFSNRRKLPDFYWTADTDMACMKAAIGQTINHAYAHHIQRLMVTGNFAMLTGIDPHEVHMWYLAVYADAYEWVELPNTLGMSQFADGGLLGSKPYAASGNYINKMSNYCRGCVYNPDIKVGDTACPFNPLYWDFLLRHRDKLNGNPRLGQIYRTWDKMDRDKRDSYRASAATLIKKLEQGVKI